MLDEATRERDAVGGSCFAHEADKTAELTALKTTNSLLERAEFELSTRVHSSCGRNSSNNQLHVGEVAPAAHGLRPP